MNIILKKNYFFHLFGDLGKMISFLLEGEAVFSQSKFVVFSPWKKFFAYWLIFRHLNTYKLE